MAKEKQTRRMVAMALAAAVTVTAVPVEALAASDYSNKVARMQAKNEERKAAAAEKMGKLVVTVEETVAEDVVLEEVTVADDMAVLEESTPEPTVDVQENTVTDSGTLEDGTTFEKEVTTVTTTTTDADGNVLELKKEETGFEETYGPAEVPEGELPEVKVELKPGEETQGSVSGTSTKTEGTLPGEGGTDYDYTTYISEIERVVKAAMSETTVTDKSTTAIIPIIAPEDYEGKVFDDSAEVHKNKISTKVDCGINHNHLFVDYDNLRKMVLDNNYEDMGVWGEQPEGFDFINCGKGEVTDAASPAVKVVYYKEDAEGNLVIDEDRPAEYINIDNHACIDSGMTNQVSIIAMKQLKEDGTAEYFYAYCADRETPTLSEETGYYQIVNIEDSDFYGKDAAEKMRAIAKNGYWGTEEGIGSLASIQEQLRVKYSEQYNDESATLTVTDNKGVEHTFTYKELIDGLKEHEALACTQGAIWNYSNGEITYDEETGEYKQQVVDGVYSAWKFINSRGGELADYYREYDMESDARMQVLYEYLIGLENEKADDVIVTAENSFESTTLVVGEKVGSYMVFDEEAGKEVDVNNDDNPDNDAYNTSIEFTLAFIPDDDGDTITVAVCNPKTGEVMKDAQGDAIVRTLLKDGSTKEVANGITPDADGAYRLDGLVFQENTDVTFDLKLEGTQNLGEGVYLYQAYGGKDASQTMIGLAAGTQNVDVTKSMTLTFDVDENNKVRATRRWHKETVEKFEVPEDPQPEDPQPEDPTPEDPTPDDPTPDDPRDPVVRPSGNGRNDVEIDEPDVPLADIPDVDVPMADAPEEGVEIADGDVPLAEAPMVAGAEDAAATGDSNHMAAGFGGMLAALAGMFMLKRKKEN